MRHLGLQLAQTKPLARDGHFGWVRTIAGRRSPWPAVALAIVLYAIGGAADARNSTPSSQDVHATIAYCKTCHGMSGQGYYGFFPMPRLAGQQAEYFTNQLRAFDERRRENQYMYGVAHVLSPAMREALAKYFNGLNPKPLVGDAEHLVPRGKTIYEEGIPASNIPACMACHGSQAKGHGEIPRLAGQLPDYIVSKLLNWTKERGQNTAKPDTSAVMAATAHALTRSDTTAIAAYVSRLQ
jgi:cytochrome c553